MVPKFYQNLPELPEDDDMSISTARRSSWHMTGAGRRHSSSCSVMGFDIANPANVFSMNDGELSMDDSRKEPIAKIYWPFAMA